MRPFLRDYFLFNRRERNGILLLVSILTALILILCFLQSGFRSIPDAAEFRQLASQSETGSSQVEVFTRTKKVYPVLESKQVPVRYFYFNPNTLDATGWMSLGLSEKQTHIILNYRNKGGKFRKAEDLSKIYGLHPEQDSLLRPWIRIPPDSSARPARLLFPDTVHQTVKAGHKLKAGEVLDLNEADSALLTRIPCTGPAFARRILVYRNKLGGFASKEQLMEVFGMDEERYNCMESFVHTGKGVYQKLALNKASIEQLKTHPY
ncbi:MAG TPA: helix-hairpin-helix domain-containing protein, partial [Bacteroidia bacterium]|nr:helix-hairpin-helix domain-containing protein [Bacteroidia bacterium]